MRKFMQPLIRPLMEFGPCLKQILEKRKISASELARTLGYKSRNSIFRILDGESGHNTRQAFYERLLEEETLALSSKERDALAQALEVSRVGKGAFMNNRALCRLLFDDPIDTVFSRSEYTTLSGGDMITADIYDSVDNAAELDLLITGCCDRDVMMSLRDSLRLSAAKIRIVHLVYTGEEEIIHNLSAIQPMIFNRNYTAYAVEANVFTRERERLLRNNMMYVHVTKRSGDTYERLFFLADKGTFMATNKLAPGAFSRMEQIVKEDAQRMRTIKMNFGEKPADYLGYLEHCLRLEQNRTIYVIKPDLPICFVPTDILRDNLLEALGVSALTLDEKAEGYVKQLEQVEQQRFENVFNKRRLTCCVFSLDAMKRFAQTGRQSDHFFAFRPYTPAERVRILTHLRRQAEENARFRLFFLKDEMQAKPMEVCLYEGLGTLIAKPNTNYDLQGDHAEALITEAAFCSCFKQYYTQDLLEKCVRSREENLAALDELIGIAKAADQA